MKYLRKFNQHILQEEFYENLDLVKDKTLVHLCEDIPHLHYENCTSTRGLQAKSIETWPINQLELLRYLEEHYPVDDTSSSTLQQTQKLKLLQSYNSLNSSDINNILNTFEYGYDYLSNNFENEAVSITGNYKLATQMFKPLDEHTIGFGITAGGGESDITLPSRSLFGLKETNSNFGTQEKAPKRAPSKATTTIGKQSTVNGENLVYEYVGNFVNRPNIAVNIGNKREFNDFDKLRNGGNNSGGGTPKLSAKAIGTSNSSIKNVSSYWWLYLLFNDCIPVRLVDLCQRENDQTDLYAVYMTYNYCISNIDLNTLTRDICTNNIIDNNDWAYSDLTDFPLIFLVRHCTNTTIEEIEDEDGNTYKEVTFDDQNTTNRVFIPFIELYHHDAEDLMFMNPYYCQISIVNDRSYGFEMPNNNSSGYTHFQIVDDNDNSIFIDINGPKFLNDENNMEQMHVNGYQSYVKLLNDENVAFIYYDDEYEGEGNDERYIIIYDNLGYRITITYDENSYSLNVIDVSNQSVQQVSNDKLRSIMDAYFGYGNSYPYIYMGYDPSYYELYIYIHNPGPDE